ncbi:MAG TPA: MFS transporter, partial [Marinobacter adhaerens]|nr:MFS transporter [Marinobacter adhaerens]
YLADVEGNYTNGLWLTLVVMALGVLMLHLARRAQQRQGEAATAG